MNKIFYSMLIGLASIVMIFNFFSGIVGGLWLVFAGGISFVIAGIIAGLIMPTIYSLVVSPSMGLLALSIKTFEKNVILGSTLLFIGSFWEKFVDYVWITLVFHYFIYQSNHFNPLALILVAYATTMAPLQYMASHENYINNGNQGLGTTLGLLYAQVVFLILTCSWFLSFSPIGILLIITLLFIAIPIYVIIKAQKSIPKEISEGAQNKNEPETADEQIDPLINHAIDIILKYKYDQVSASLFQRRLAINYERAAKIRDTLAQYGIVKRTNNSAPNKVLINDSSELEKMKQVFASMPKYGLERFKDDEDIKLDDRDSIYPEVIEYIKKINQASAEILQKKFDIGYARASRIMDHLEEDGYLNRQTEDNINSQDVTDPNNDLIKKTGTVIEMTLAALGIGTKVVEINTKKNGVEYCLDVELGSSLENIMKLERNIALAVASPTGKVRIQAPIPGRSLIGIFVPAKK